MSTNQENPGVPAPPQADESVRDTRANSSDSAAQANPEKEARDPEIERIHTGGDTAVEAFRKVKGEGTRQAQLVQRYETEYAPLNHAIGQLGGASEVARQLQIAAIAVSDPRYRKVWNHISEHGTLPTSNELEDDPYQLDDDDDDDPKDPRVSLLEAEVTALKNRQSAGDYQQGIERTKGYFNRLQQEHEPYWDDLRDFVSATFQEWNTTAQGRNAISSLNYDTLEMIAGKWIAQNRDKVVLAMNDRLVNTQHSKSTGNVSGTSTNGRERSQDKRHMDVLSAWKQGEREGAW